MKRAAFATEVTDGQHFTLILRPSRRAAMEVYCTGIGSPRYETADDHAQIMAPQTPFESQVAENWEDMI